MVRYPPWYLVSHRHVCAIPHFATYRAIIVRYSTKTSTKEFCDTIAGSIARYEKYRYWASKDGGFLCRCMRGFFSWADGAAQRGVQFLFIFAVLRVLFLHAANLPLKSLHLHEGNPLKHRSIFAQNLRPIPENVAYVLSAYGNSIFNVDGFCSLCVAATSLRCTRTSARQQAEQLYTLGGPISIAKGNGLQLCEPPVRGTQRGSTGGGRTS